MTSHAYKESNDLAYTHRQIFPQIEQHGAVAQFHNRRPGVRNEKYGSAVVLDCFDAREAFALEKFISTGAKRLATTLLFLASITMRGSGSTQNA